jgi:serine/threonine protein kinase
MTPSNPQGTMTTFCADDIVTNRYRIIRFLGRGGMGEVYEAYDQLLGESIALKTLRNELAHNNVVLHRFQKEIQLARKVTHRNVCRVFDVGVHAPSGPNQTNVHFFTMELLIGQTLTQRIQSRGRLPASEAFPLIVEMATGLDAAHQAGIIHRDFKSSNVILTSGRAVITDFGLARNDVTSPVNADLERTVTLEANVVGTPAYMSPEQFTGGKIAAASDIYSFGVVLFEMATGQLPFAGNHLIQSAVQRAKGEIPDVRLMAPDIHTVWEKSIRRCLQPDPEQRYGSMGEIADLFRIPTEPSAAAQIVSPLKAKRGLRVALVFAVLVLLGIAIFLNIPRFRDAQLADGSEIVMTPTINTTGEERFDGLTAVFRETLGQSSRFRLATIEHLDSVARSLRHDPQTPLTTKDWREVSFRDSAPFLVFSTLSRLGDEYAITLHCEQIGSSPDPPVNTWNKTFTASGSNELFDVIHSATAWIRSTAGENVKDLSARNRLPQDITTSNWEALELFERAEETARKGDPSSALPLLRRAIQLDPDFAMALMETGNILVSQQRSEEGYAYWRQAIQKGREQRLSDAERFRIESRYAMEIGDYVAAEPVLREWMDKFPNEASPSSLLSAALVAVGRYPEAISISRQHNSRFGPTLFSVTRIIHALGMSRRLDEAGPELNILRPISGTWELRFRGSISASREDYAAAEATFQELANRSKGGESSRTTSLLAALAAERGNFDEAARLLEAGITRDREGGESGLAAQKASALAFVENLRGNRARARAWAFDAVQIEASPRIVMQSVSVLARQGFIDDAQRLSARMPSGEGPTYQSFLLRMRGEILAAQENYHAALDSFEKAARIGSVLQPDEYLARTLELSGQHERARHIYSEIVDTPWFTWLSPEAEWPGVRFIAKRYIQSSKGE